MTSSLTNFIHGAALMCRGFDVARALTNKRINMNDKELVADAALDYVKNNSIVGLGTGSTADIFINALAKKISAESLNIKVVASSTSTHEKANTK